MPPLEITSTSPRGRYASSSNLPTPRTPTLTITSSSPVATPGLLPCSGSSSSSSSAGSSPSSVTTVTTIESHSSSTGPSRDLISEYLAAKSRSQQAPAIFNPKLTQTGPHEEQLELAYKHPILLMDEEENVVFCSAASSVGNERNREVEVKYIEDNSIELLEAKEEIGEGEKESLIVPKPKMMAFHSPKASPVKTVDDPDGKCRLVGRVNPNILKTWEQLSGGGGTGSEKNFCEHKRKNSRNSLITVTSSENSGGDKQSCLIFYRNQYGVEPEEEANDFRVMKIRHRESVSESSTTIADGRLQEEEGDEEEVVVTSIATTTTTATTTTDTTSSEGCYDFYDSIDDNSNRVGGIEDDEDEEEYALAAGEGLAEFASLDRTKLMWSIDVE